MSALRLGPARAFVGCELHDAEGLALIDDEAVPMREIGEVVSIDFEIDPPNMTPENDSP